MWKKLNLNSVQHEIETTIQKPKPERMAEFRNIIKEINEVL